MYIMTKDKGIINLDCYPRIDVFTKNNNCYLLCAFSKLEANAEPRDGVIIAEFDKKENADYTFRSLSKAITVNKPTWDVGAVELLSDLWDQVKEQLPSDVVPPDVLENLELKVSGLNEVTIIYPSNFDSKVGTYITENDKKKVEGKLTEVLKAKSSVDVEWRVEWESSD